MDDSQTSSDARESPPYTGADEPKPSGGTMVIIEDDASVADYYATLFRGNGYRVEVANDGVSGVRLALEDNNTTGKFLNQHFSLEEVRIKEGDDLVDHGHLPGASGRSTAMA